MKYSRYFESKLVAHNESFAKKIMEKFILRILPNSNPDFENSYQGVREWWFEIDSNGVVVREIGLDKTGTPVVVGPWGDNIGVFTDAGHPPLHLIDNLDKSDFEDAWSRVAR